MAEQLVPGKGQLFVCLEDLELFRELLNSLGLAVGTHQGIEDGQHVPSVIDHARKNVAELRVVLGFTVPLGKHGAGYFNVLSQLVSGMSTQKETIEKRRFALREIEILQNVGWNELWHRGHREKGSLPKSVSASSRTYDFLARCR